MVLRRRRKSSGNGRNVQARLSALRTAIDDLQEHTRGLVTEVGGAATQQVQGAVTGALSTAQETAERIEDWGTENLGGVRKVVRSQPLAACVLSMSAGALIGALLLR
jgi:hypothetical protein